jgi:hypothetical protein
MIWLAALSLSTAPAPPAPLMAGFLDASQLAAACRPAERGDVAMDGLCLGYVLGVVDQSLSAQARRPGPQRFCLPNDVTAEEVRARIVARLAVAPRPGTAAASLVRQVLEQEFPCRATRP